MGPLPVQQEGHVGSVSSQTPLNLTQHFPCNLHSNIIEPLSQPTYLSPEDRGSIFLRNFRISHKATCHNTEYHILSTIS
jgi:hypothetical protein